MRNAGERTYGDFKRKCDYFQGDYIQMYTVAVSMLVTMDYDQT